MHTWGPIRITLTGVGSRSDVNLHHPQTATAGDTSGSGTVMYFFLNISTPRGVKKYRLGRNMYEKGVQHPWENHICSHFLLMLLGMRSTIAPCPMLQPARSPLHYWHYGLWANCIQLWSLITLNHGSSKLYLHYRNQSSHLCSN